MMMASAVGDDQQQSWLPYESTTMKDCSQGFCSIYCPQWCYIVFPPPPPLDDQSDSSSGGATLSPLVIAVVGILTSVFLLVSYYTIISKYCTSFDFLSHRRRLRRRHAGDDQEAHGGGQLRHETLHAVASEGLDDDAIKLLATYKYKKRDWSLEGSDCSVCLSEFREDEILRLLPKCGHAFHVSCIDTWLKSHSNCPLCRANIPPNCAAGVLPVPTQRPSPPPECWTSPPADMIVPSAEDSRRTREGANSNMTSGSQVTADATMEAKYLFMISRESEGMEQMRRSSSCLRNVMEIEDTGDHVEGSSRKALSGSEHHRSRHRNGNHHYRWSSRTKASRSMMISPVVMKRKSTCNGRSQNPIKYHQYSYQAEGNENSNDATLLPV